MSALVSETLSLYINLHRLKSLLNGLTLGSYGGLFVFLVTSSFVFIGVVGLSKLEYQSITQEI